MKFTFHDCGFMIYNQDRAIRIISLNTCSLTIANITASVNNINNRV